MTKKKNVLICIDRDGTLIYDDDYYLGSQKNWKKLIRILRGVIVGVKKLNKIKGAALYIVTNQSGVAIKSYPLLTRSRANRVNHQVLDLLEERGAHFDGYLLCDYVSKSYVKSHPQHKFDRKFVKDADCIKPKPGMVLEALRREGWTKRNTEIYLIGDRLKDVKAAKNVGGVGILVPFINRPEEVKKVKDLKWSRKYIASDFLDAVEFILKREKGR